MVPGAAVIDSFGIDEQRETGFGTGLRAHLTRDALPPLVPPALTEEPVELEPVEWHGDPAPLPERSHADERAVELEAYAAELGERERRLAEYERELAEESHRLAAAESVRTSERRPVSEILREHADYHAERLLLILEQALDATDEAGRPDHHARLAALRLLLDEARDEPGAERASPIEDELGELRRRRGIA
jgi:hypothetical protein